MHLFLLAIVFYTAVCASSLPALAAEPDDPALLAAYRDAAMNSGDAARGATVFASKQAACIKCHAVAGKERMAGPDLAVIGDKYTREQLIQAVLEPSLTIHPDYAAHVFRTTNGKVYTGVLRRRTDQEIQLLDAEGKLVRIPLAEVDEQQPSKNSLMPAAVYKTVEVDAFADLIAYLTTLKQQEGDPHPGMPSVIQELAKPIRLTPLHTEQMRFDHPVCIMAKPGAQNQFLIVEQKTRKIWLLEKNSQGDRKELFADLSSESLTGEFEGVMCLAFHPNFLKNRKYYLNYHVREEGIFSPVIVERQATEDLSCDAGGVSKRLLRIKQPTDLHWGGMVAFGPDGYLYIGAGDGGPQEDPDGNGQNLSNFLGKILRIDVDHASAGKPYAIPQTNPFKKAADGALPEIWAYGMRMPWRFSWDAKTGDLWVGNIGQDLFEEVLIARVGENHGWNVYEGFMPFSEQYRREDEKYVPPVVSYRRKYGVSVTGGYVYRGSRSPSYVGAYIFGDFESKRLWALTQKDGKLDKIRQIGVCPEKPASFGIDSEGELFVVGYQGTIYRLLLEDSVFE
ncbi:PQQ-dependent sugar dehydrogenase [Lignipirellula cremea]|uniref:Soluble aldose sugar dehydrogenase YliI n=1 Tax=Lignipirellula cremea TaxID=2528010 RepID=A0A518DKH9_9BACT|nr:PQQ-dependent sugar dehydrogenase [Lignipirellula cremea]QDU92343.1 Soluble aldose sugar dehydrogenase YliI precursor [Lignipirellula cremea]